MIYWSADRNRGLWAAGQKKNCRIRQIRGTCHNENLPRFPRFPWLRFKNFSSPVRIQRVAAPMFSGFGLLSALALRVSGFLLLHPGPFVEVAKLTPLRDNEIAILVHGTAMR